MILIPDLFFVGCQLNQFVLLHNSFPIYIRSYEEAAGGLWRVLAHGVAAERGDDRHAD